ncbi:MAG: hydrolase [Gemmatimonadota bacterium]|nr:hydrolase [Gemmatimonadota bacterium]
MTDFPLRYRPAWWIPGAHAQTLWGRIFRREPVATRVERWETPDADFLELHRLGAPPGFAPNTPHVAIFHGLEGGIRSHYAQGLFSEMRRRGWSADLVIWRSCGSEPNRARRFYHSGETGDLALALKRMASERPGSPLAAVGISLGGNVLLKYLGEQRSHARELLFAAAAVSVPFDLARGSDNINVGFSRVYQKYFLNSLKRKAIEKQTRCTDLPAPERVNAIATLRDFDDTLTAPIHGFNDAADYYDRASSIHYLGDVAVDTLLLNALDDPFLPRDVLDEVARIARGNRHLTLDFPAHGGHAGFVGGWNPFRPVYYLERRVGEFLATHLTMSEHM